MPSEIREHLLPFQEKAIQIACRHLNKRGGVLIGDVVGLGKTRIAAAIARVLGDDQMLETLILCPKNLTTMWQDYAHKFGLRAPRVLSQSVAQRDLPELVRYRLLIVDESHNFRNKEGRIYQAIQDYLFRNDCKVIIRLIQRAGRVDRIGQKRDTIHCYSFLPADGVENIIRLRRRLSDRLRENEEVVGSDENFFEDQTPGDEDALRHLYDEKSGILDEPKDDEVDLTSEAYEAWAQATKDNPELRKAVEALPDVVFATKKHLPPADRPADLSPAGVLSYIRTPQDHDALLWMDADGKTVSESPLRIFRQAKCAPDEPALPRRADHHPLVTRALEIVEEQRRDFHSGSLGSRRGARFRAYERLQDYLRHREGDLFLTDHVRAAIQAIYDHPLTTEAVDKLNRQLRTNISDDDLANLVTQLHRDDRLVIVNLHDEPAKEPRILCSIGMAD